MEEILHVMVGVMLACLTLFVMAECACLIKVLYMGWKNDFRNW